MCIRAIGALFSLVACVCGAAIGVSGQAPASAPAGERVSIYAAGSLAAAFEGLRPAIRQALGIDVVVTLGASGVLRQRIEAGQRPSLFLSANLTHPDALAAAGIGSPTRLFARNTLCAYTGPGRTFSPVRLLEHLLERGTRVGISTPVADPAGDYALEMFGRADELRPGSAAELRAKAMPLMGGPAVDPRVPPGANAQAFFLGAGVVDVFLYYCSGAGAIQAASPAIDVVELPSSLAVGADYGLTVIEGAPASADAVADFILSPAGRVILRDAGFAR